MKALPNNGKAGRAFLFRTAPQTTVTKEFSSLN